MAQGGSVADGGLQLCHLSDVALKHVAACYGLAPHQERASLLQAIQQHLLESLPYSWKHATIGSPELKEDPTAGYGFSLVEHDGLLWLFGGRNGLTNSPIDMLTFDPESEEWASLDELQGAAPSRRWHAAHKLGGDRMLVVGGQVWLPEDRSWQDAGGMLEFHFSTRTWSDVPQLGEQPAPRMKCASAVIGDQLFMLSGDDDAASHSAGYGSVHLFDIRAHTWTARACSGRVPAPKAVEAFTAHEGSVYAVTADRSCDCLQVFKLDTATFIWSLLSASGPAPSSRQQFAAATFQGLWIISGGVLAGTQFVVGGIYSFDFRTATWGVVAAGLQDGDVDLTKRACHTAAVLGGKLYTTGGWHGGWPKLLDGIVLSREYLPAAGGASAGSAAAVPGAAAAPPDAAAASAAAPAAPPASSVPNCELARLVARCRREHLSYADVLLVAADGSVHECHKVVLAAQSPVFDRMFQAEMQEAATGRVVMDDVSPDALDALLHYLYGGCTLQPSITVELFTVADRYAIEGLRMECALNMQQCLGVDNVAVVASLASLHELHGLWEACLAFAAAFNVQPLVFASRAYSQMWVDSPAAAQEFTTQVAAKAAESYQLVAGGGGGGGGAGGGQAPAAAAGVLPVKRARVHL